MTKSQNILLSTRRLILSQFLPADLDFIAELHADPDVMRYIGPPRSRSEVAERLERISSQYKSMPGLGIWKATLKENGTPIGWACLKDLDGSEHIEVGYRLASQYWGQGYATELTKSLLEHGFRELALDEIVAVCRPDNLGSKRVLEKAGFEFVKKATYYSTQVLFFTISRSTWESSNLPN